MVQQVVAVEQTAIKQAFYNTVANLFLILTLWAFFVLYFVFEQFVRPLLWAVTVGVFLHPLKQEAIRRTRAWLSQLMRTDTPLLLGLLTLPFKLLTITEELVKQRWGRFFLFAAVLFCLFALDTVQQVVISTFLFLRGALYLFVWLVEITVRYFFLNYAFIRSCLYPLVAAYALVAFLCWRYHFPRLLRAVNIVVWCLGLAGLLPFLVEYLGMWPFLVGAAATFVVAGMGFVDRGGLSWERVVREYELKTTKADDDEPSDEPISADEPPGIAGSGVENANARSASSRDDEGVTATGATTTGAAMDAEDDDRVRDEVTSAEICMLLLVSCLAVTFWEWVPWLLFWGWIFSVLKWLVRTYIDFAYIKQVLLLFFVYQFLRRGSQQHAPAVKTTIKAPPPAPIGDDDMAKKGDKKLKKKVTLKSLDEEDEEEEDPLNSTTVIHPTEDDTDEDEDQMTDEARGAVGDNDDGVVKGNTSMFDIDDERDDDDEAGDEKKTATEKVRKEEKEKEEEEEEERDALTEEWTPHKATTVRIKRSHSAPLRKKTVFFGDLVASLPQPPATPSAPMPVVSEASGGGGTLEYSVSFDHQPLEPYHPKALDLTRRFPTRRQATTRAASERKVNDIPAKSSVNKKDNVAKENEAKETKMEKVVMEEEPEEENGGLASEVSEEETTELLNTFVPYPIRRTVYFFMRGDKRVVAWLHQQMNGIMTLIILFLLVSLILSLPVFFVVKFSEETALFRDYATEMWHSTGKHKVTQQLKDLQSDEVADAVLQYIQQWPEEARMWAERKLKDSTGYDIPLSVLQDTFNQFWANYGVSKDASYHQHHQLKHANANATHVAAATNTTAPNEPNTGSADSSNATAAAVVEEAGGGDKQSFALGNATAHEHFLLKLTNHWWPGFSQRHAAATDGSGGNNDHGSGAGGRGSAESADRPTRLDIQALFSHEGFVNFYHANANIISSVWNYLKFNFTLLLGWLLNTLWSTSQRVFNFLFSVILFFTTLFYLLVASDDRGSYIPFKWFLFIFPKDGGTRVMVQEAITQAINEVFLSLVKISIFHALWTWLTLTILGVRIVYISTFLTLLFVIFPVIGPYWVSLPACLELWLVGKPVHAVVLFCLHMAAAWYIDPKIYSEIKMGHYYVTGLAVVGGLYFLGLEGVIIGPTVLCVLLFLYKILNKRLNP